MTFAKKMVLAKISAKVKHSGKNIRLSSIVALFPLTPCIPLITCPWKSCLTVDFIKNMNPSTKIRITDGPLIVRMRLLKQIFESRFFDLAHHGIENW